MPRVTDEAVLSAATADDILMIVDVHDTTQSPQGTTKQIQVGNTVPVVSAADTSVVVGGTTLAPTIATGTLDVIAADHPPAANWSNNGKKITSVANATAGTDVTAFGQTLAGGAGFPMTSQGDLLTMNATPAPARLAVGAVNNVLGVSGGAPGWQIGMTLQTQTAAAGFTLANSTNTIITWTTPNDGAQHHVIFTAYVFATSTMTGGQINCSFTDPAGNVITGVSLVSGGLTTANANWNFQILPIKANTTVTISQGTALTAGAAKCWAEIWGC